MYNRGYDTCDHISYVVGDTTIECKYIVSYGCNGCFFEEKKYFERYYSNICSLDTARTLSTLEISFLS